MSWTRIWVHMVFSTKEREPFLSPKETRDLIINHIKYNAKEKEIWLEEINGYLDHLHCLIFLGRDQSISKIAQLIKGESSNWINKNQVTKNKFTWQDDYWAVSVSESHLANVKKYICEQEEHHNLKKFTEEVDYLIKKNG